jgi:hypothetical protein
MQQFARLAALLDVLQSIQSAKRSRYFLPFGYRNNLMPRNYGFTPDCVIGEPSDPIFFLDCHP